MIPVESWERRATVEEDYSCWVSRERFYYSTFEFTSHQPRTRMFSTWEHGETWLPFVDCLRRLPFFFLKVKGCNVDSDFDKALLLAVDSHVDSLIREQIDSKAVRIRRLIRARGYLEEETVRGVERGLGRVVLHEEGIRSTLHQSSIREHHRIHNSNCSVLWGTWQCHLCCNGCIAM